MKKSGDELGRALLEEVIRAYFQADESRIPSIRNSEDWLINDDRIDGCCFFLDEKVDSLRLIYIYTHNITKDAHIWVHMDRSG